MPKKTVSTKKKKTRKKSKLKQYFHEGTQAAIEKFQAESSLEKKAKIYESEILPAFEKLSENLIFIHRFTSLHSSYEDLKNDCITFLYEALYKFDASRGTKAFSYFNVVAKNFLIIKSKQRTKFLKRNISLENPAAFTQDETVSLNNHNSVPAQEERIIRQEKRDVILEMIEKIEGIVKSDNEKACIYAVRKLFEGADDLEFLNKRAIFVYLREMSGLNPKQLTTTISSLKKKYNELRKLEEFDAFL
jgi:hypothetical protein